MADTLQRCTIEEYVLPGGEKPILTFLVGLAGRDKRDAIAPLQERGDSRRGIERVRAGIDRPRRPRLGSLREEPERSRSLHRGLRGARNAGRVKGGVSMTKPTVGSPQTVRAWMEGELKSDAEVRRQVDGTLNRLRIEQRLADLRERRNLSQRQLAAIIGVKQPVIAKIESGTGKNLELRTLIRIAAALGAKVRIRIEDDQPARPAKGGGVTRRRSKAGKPNALKVAKA
jgi:DNA-binding XRE family transcriptional regulator